MIGSVLFDSRFRFGVSSVDIVVPEQTHSVVGGPITDSGDITIAPLAVNAVGDITGATTYDWNNGWIMSARLIGNVTWTLSNPINGQVYRMLIRQDGTGSRTLTWPGTVIAPGGSVPTINAASSSLTSIELIWDGTNYIIFMNKTGS